MSMLFHWGEVPFTVLISTSLLPLVLLMIEQSVTYIQKTFLPIPWVPQDLSLSCLRVPGQQPLGTRLEVTSDTAIGVSLERQLGFQASNDRQVLLTDEFFFLGWLQFLH